MKSAMLCAQTVKKLAYQSNFTLAGCARAERLDRTYFDSWISKGHHGSMEWIARRPEIRFDPTQLVVGAKTVVALGICFFTRQHHYYSSSPIAKYAQGRDYHAILRERLTLFRKKLLQLWPKLGVYSEVDTGPVQEKTWASRAGLGWIGKNGLLINPEYGSWVVLAVAIIDAPVDHYDAPMENLCGECSLCLRNCPTKALISPRQLDARQCLSYQSIENKDEYPQQIRQYASQAFGCDRCQTVCPWNRTNHFCDDPQFAPGAVAQCSLVDLALLSVSDFQKLTKGTAIARIGVSRLRRNAIIALGARKEFDFLGAKQCLTDSDHMVQAASLWAISCALPTKI